MKLTGPTRVFLACGAFLSILVYLVIVDLGVHAGRIHRGVTVDGVAVGGLTQAEAQRLLTDHGMRLRRTPIVFTTEGYDCRLIPGRVGWRPNPALTARRAMAVGRSGRLATSIRDRLRSWFGGDLSVPWGGAPSDEVEGFVEECAERGAAYGVQVDRDRLAREMERLMSTWPRDQLHELPLEG